MTSNEWLTVCADKIISEIITPFYKPRSDMKIRVTIGQIKIDMCCISYASDEGFNEIIICTDKKNSLQILQSLTHQCIHAVDDCENGHSGLFSDIFNGIGMVGEFNGLGMASKKTGFNVSKELKAKLSTYIKQYGEFTHI